MINIKTSNFGTLGSNGATGMGDAAIAAAQATRQQLLEIGLTTATIGITPTVIYLISEFVLCCSLDARSDKTKSAQRFSASRTPIRFSTTPRQMAGLAFYPFGPCKETPRSGAQITSKSLWRLAPNLYSLRTKHLNSFFALNKSGLPSNVSRMMCFNYILSQL